jgi:DNA modification methylase
MATQLAERVPLARLTPAPWNPRLIRDARFANLCKSIEADPGFLEQRPILATADGTIYAGNMRYRAVQHLGWPDVPAIVADIPEQLAKERALRDNAQWGDWQDDDLAALLYGLGQQGSDLDLLGFEDEALTRLLESVGGLGDTPTGEDPGAQIDRAAELQEKGQTARGQLWTIGRHRLLCGDSTSAEDVARLMGGERADVCITSPPYNAGTPGWADSSKYRNDDDDRSALDYGSWLSAFTQVALAYSHVAAINVQMVSGNKRALLEWMHTWRDHLADIAIWDKQTAEPAMEPGVLDSAFEFVVMLSSERDAKRKLPLTAFRGEFQNVYRGPKQSRNEFSEIHNATFPLHLPEWLLTVFSLATSVYEPFSGTGTTFVASEQAGRSCYGIDIDPGYVAVTLERLSGMGLSPVLTEDGTV